MTPRILILVLSCKAPPYDTLEAAQRETWAEREIGNGGTYTRFYHPTSLDTTHMLVEMDVAIREAWRLEWTHLFRTNASSYVDKERLWALTASLPERGLYAGVDGGGFVSGSGILMSRDVVGDLLFALPTADAALVDDEAIGKLAFAAITPLPRLDYWIDRELAEMTGQMAAFKERVRAAHHVRCKHVVDRHKDVEAMKDVHRIKRGM